MTDDRSLERAARSWLEEGPTRAPDRPVEAALSRIKTTPQERDLVPRRITSLPTFAKLAAAAAVVVVVGGGALFALNGLGPSVGASPSPAAPASPSPAASAADPTAAYRSARNRICMTAVQAFTTYSDLVGLYDESTPPDRRTIVNANAQAIADAMTTMATDLATLEAPAQLAEGHVADVARAQNLAAVFAVATQALREGRYSDARAMEAAQEAVSNLRRPFEEANDLFNCP